MMNSKQYNRYVARLSPKSKVWKNVCFAFLIGGAICTLGQLLLVAFEQRVVKCAQARRIRFA